MSSSEDAPRGATNSTIDNLRRQAKTLLKQARTGDPVLLGRLRKLLPRMNSLDDATMTASIKLADVQHAIARQNGKTSWKELTAFLKTVDPIHMHAARFLLALRNDNATQAQVLFEAHPELARYSIHTAAALGHAALVRASIAADPASATHATSPDGTEPIIYASHGGLQEMLGVAHHDRVDTVRALLDAGANANAFILDGDDPNSRIPALYFACVSNNVDVARVLLERGANPNDGESVYHAAERNHRECLALLAEFGADLSASHSHWGNTPLYFLAGHKSFSPLCASSELGMQWLLEHGADPNVRSYAKAKSDGTPGDSETPLHRVAAYGKSADVARMLVDHGAQVDTPRGDGKTAYALAVRVGNQPVAAYLASVGADTAMVTPVDRLLNACVLADEPAARAVVSAHPALVASLTTEDRQALALAVEDGRDASVRLMLSLGWSLADEGAWAGTPLHHAAWHGRVAMARMLLDLGADVNARDSAYGSSPIAWAAHGSVNGRAGHDEDYVAVVKLLLETGASRAASYNKWNEAPEQLASKEVADVIRRAVSSTSNDSVGTEGGGTVGGEPNYQTPDR